MITGYLCEPTQSQFQVFLIDAIFYHGLFNSVWCICHHFRVSHSSIPLPCPLRLLLTCTNTYSSCTTRELGSMQPGKGLPLLASVQFCSLQVIYRASERNGNEKKKSLQNVLTLERKQGQMQQNAANILYQVQNSMKNVQPNSTDFCIY